MLDTVQDAIEDVVARMKSDGAVLDINEAADQIIERQRATGDHIGDKVALALIKAASRRGLAIRIHQK